MSPNADAPATSQPHRAPVQVGPPPARPRPRARRPLVPSWGLKVAMAVTGAIWTAFVVIHLFGNLKVFQGPDAFNTYAHWLREAFYPLMPKYAVLWAMRVVLGVALIVHATAAGLIWWRGRRARGPHRARIRGHRAWAARAMPATGIIILIFIVIHVLDLTLGWGVQPDSFLHPTADTSYAYHNLVASFQRPLFAVFYSAVMLVLAAHVTQGFSSLASDLGSMGRRWRACLTVAGGLLALAILLGNGAIPLLVLAGAIT